MMRFKSKWIFLATIIIILLIIYIGSVLFPYQEQHQIECPVISFEQFAFLPNKSTNTKILPEYPWQAVTVIPEQLKSFLDIRVSTARMKDGEEEVWLFKMSTFRYGEIYEHGSFFVFKPSSQAWEEISAKVAGTNLIVRQLFVTSDGNVWGTLDQRQDPSIPNTIPTLTKYNEQTKQFEIVDTRLPEPVWDAQMNNLIIPNVILDEQDAFWIFIQGDGIYYYDPKSAITERRASLPNMKSLDTTLAPNGSIYFRDQSIYGISEFLFQFMPTTGEIERYDIPSRSWWQAWPLSSGMLADQQGHLWLGATGYMDTEGHWHRIHTHPRESIKHLGEPSWIPPRLIFESSDGLLWYTEFLDMGLFGAGTAWYDPETGQGCSFTNIASNIVEDSEKQLWMVADGKLYRYSLEQ